MPDPKVLELNLPECTPDNFYEIIEEAEKRDKVVVVINWVRRNGIIGLTAKEVHSVDEYTVFIADGLNNCLIDTVTHGGSFYKMWPKWWNTRIGRMEMI